MSDRVTLTRLYGRNVATGAEQMTSLSRVRLDGHQVGWYEDGSSRVSYIVTNVSDVDKSLIKDAVYAIMGIETDSIECPPVPEPREFDEESEYDDFQE